MNAWLEKLRERFHAGGRLHWTMGPAGPEARLQAPAAEGRLTLQGGQLLQWRPQGADPVLWLSPRARLAPGAAIRGGVPVCWPWFGPHPERVDFPAHGFARTARWEPLAAVPERGGVRLSLALVRDAASYHLFPHRARPTLELHLGETLEMALITRNEDRRPFTLGQALHAYFQVGDVQCIRIHGLAGRAYLDKTRGLRRFTQHGPVRLEGETDRVYLGAGGPVTIEDPALGRAIRVEKAGSATTVVWNPGEAKGRAMGDVGEAWREFVCVEAANALADARALVPGAVHRLVMRCAVVP